MKWLRKIRETTRGSSWASPPPEKNLSGLRRMADMIPTDDDLARLDIVHGWEYQHIGEDEIPNPRYYAGVGQNQRILLVTIAAKGAGNSWTPEQLLHTEMSIQKQNHEKGWHLLDERLFSKFTCENYTCSVYLLPGNLHDQSYGAAIAEMYGRQSHFACLGFTYNPTCRGSFEEMVQNFKKILEKCDGDNTTPVPALVLAINSNNNNNNNNKSEDGENLESTSEDEGKTNLERGEAFTEEKAYQFFQCCGETGKGVTEGFFFGVVRASHRHRVLWEGDLGGLRSNCLESARRLVGALFEEEEEEEEKSS
ncbi:hypothetical protein QBC44DRAFT_311554 [Cladorrhinum sp. PSN332]|nr:hypothetical protein QBC44DRAFT_311554 [Cladorrhinum sp. PSN332]